MAINQEAPKSPSPVIDSAVKNSWKGGLEPGKKDPKQILNEKYNEKTVEPSSMK